jgi:hypothetical protein
LTRFVTPDEQCAPVVTGAVVFRLQPLTYGFECERHVGLPHFLSLYSRDSEEGGSFEPDYQPTIQCRFTFLTFCASLSFRSTATEGHAFGHSRHLVETA